MVSRRTLLAAALAVTLPAAARAGGDPLPADAGLAIRCDKVLTVDDDDRVFSPGMLLVEEGRIAYVGPPKEVPEGYELVELDGWAAPGLVDLHTHVHTGGWGDINDMVMSLNPELRASAGLRPANRLVQVACAGGVTTLFGIPGSGTNISGFGVLYKARTSGGWDEVVKKDPAGMKVAQDSNPQGRAGNFAFGNSRASMGWQLEDVADRAKGALAQGRFDPSLENLKKVLSRELPVLIHTAGSEGVINTARMWKRKYDTRCFVSHGSFDGWKAAKALAEWGMPVNHGPRTTDFSRRACVASTCRSTPCRSRGSFPANGTSRRFARSARRPVTPRRTWGFGRASWRRRTRPRRASRFSGSS